MDFSNYQQYIGGYKYSGTCTHSSPKRTLASSVAYLHHGDYQKPNSIYQPSRPCTHYPSPTKTIISSSQPKPSHITRPTTNHPTPPPDVGTSGTTYPTAGQHDRGTSPA
ncbi:unnamed protein product [Lupinus luteus]|uniref:Uncharacterized protein n=1 Tax=Lupinus luteus TaxID=3873 RepID=A0AAV1WNP5_LUPLU